MLPPFRSALFNDTRAFNYLCLACSIVIFLLFRQLSLKGPRHPRATRQVAAATMTLSSTKVLRLLRHGQALHNINAERMRAEGCSFEAFLAQMKEDDALDASLTDLGREQARALGASAEGLAASASVHLVVASTLSRAIDTADLAFPVENSFDIPRVVLEDIREINGMLLNGKRRTRSELKAQYYPIWNFDHIQCEEDNPWNKWGPERLEDDESVRARAHAALVWIWERPERDIALVAHGGIFNLLTNGHPLVEVGPGVNNRFGNCELRNCLLSVSSIGEEETRFRLELAS